MEGDLTWRVIASGCILQVLSRGPRGRQPAGGCDHHLTLYVPGGKVLYAAAENAGECPGSGDEEREAALSLFGTSDDLTAVQGVLEFFKALLGG